MILVDTSVWIEHFRKGSIELERLLGEAQVLAHPFVIGELACGNLAARARILELLGRLPQAPLATPTAGEVLLALPTPTALTHRLSQMTLRPQAMPDQYKQADAVLAYRDYYRHEKSDMLTYTKRAAPEWITNA